MNLHQIVSGSIATVNPFIPATLRQSTGYTTSPDGKQVPTYAETQMMIQVQALSNDELRQVESLNLQGNKQAVYVGGAWNGIVRSGRQGGDLLIFGGQTWLVVIQIENWPQWVKLAVVLQNGS